MVRGQSVMTRYWNNPAKTAAAPIDGWLDTGDVAMPDAVMGVRSCAFVILKPGQSLTLSQLVGFLEEKQIAKFKLPERLEIVHSFPLSGMGKVSKKDLRDIIAAKLRAEGAID